MAAEIGACDFFGPKPLVAMGAAAIASGGVAAIMVSEISFVGGVIFGGVFQAVTLIVAGGVGWCCRSCHIDLAQDDFLSRVIRTVVFALAVIAGIAAAVEITTLAGYVVTYDSGLGLAAATFAVGIVFHTILGCYFLANMGYYVERAERMRGR